MAFTDHDLPETSALQGAENLAKRRRTAGPEDGGLDRLSHVCNLLPGLY